MFFRVYSWDQKEHRIEGITVVSALLPRFVINLSWGTVLSVKLIGEGGKLTLFEHWSLSHSVLVYSGTIPTPGDGLVKQKISILAAEEHISGGDNCLRSWCVIRAHLLSIMRHLSVDDI